DKSGFDLSAGDAARAEELLEIGVQGRRGGDAELVVKADHRRPLVAAQLEVDLGRAGVRAQHLAELLDHRRHAAGHRQAHHERTQRLTEAGPRRDLTSAMKLLPGWTLNMARLSRRRPGCPCLVRFMWTGALPGWACRMRFSSVAS